MYAESSSKYIALVHGVIIIQNYFIYTVSVDIILT